MHDVVVAVSKGRIWDDMEALWTEAGWQWPIVRGRQLTFPPSGQSPGLLMVRGSDVPTLVRLGAAQFGIVGRDVLAEHPDHGVLDVLDLGIGQCRLVLAGQSAQWPAGPARVATKYPHSTRSFFHQIHHPVEIVPLSGSVELAPVIGLASYIVDLVATGQTLRAHGLMEIQEIFTSTARLVVNPGFWRRGLDGRALVAALAAAINTREEQSRCPTS